MGMFFTKDVGDFYLGSSKVSEIYLGSTQVWPVGLPVGTIFNFGYTGSVQEIELPKGKYKLQCWGAQGGRSYASSSYTGSKGGYSEGVLTLTEKKTLYVFVGGQGSYGSTTSLVNGGWNGGGASVGYATYSSGGIGGSSYPASGGGATDIATVTSSMSYSSGRTNRSSASLLSRCIVAGGGAGASYAYKSEEYSYEGEVYEGRVSNGYYNPSGDMGSYTQWEYSFSSGTTYVLYPSSSTERIELYSADWTQGIAIYAGEAVTLSFNAAFLFVYSASKVSSVSIYRIEQITDINEYEEYSNKSQQGGGTSGRGQYPGTQSAAGNGGAFGLGANQTTTNYRYCSGAGGGGWYGGGRNYSDSSMSYVNYSGGGSGFVNTAANASYRPSGYTGLQLDSGTTTAGNASFPSTSGGTETGHSGNGYARITVL